MKYLSLFLFSLCFLQGCSSTNDNPKLDQQFQVVATTTMIADMVQAVGGDKVDVDSLMGPGIDPHLYRPSGLDVKILSNADIVFYNGLYLEGKMEDLFSKLKGSGREIYAVSDAIPREELIRINTGNDGYDPHIWFDPLLWAACVDLVSEALSKNDPSNSDFYNQRASLLKDTYYQSKKSIDSLLSVIPKEKRVLITSHDAFNYFGRSFDFEVIGLQGISTVSEAGLADIAEMVDLIKERKIKAIFIESSVSSAGIDRISRDSGVIVGGELFSDAFGAQGEIRTLSGGSTYDVGTWMGVLKYNASVIRRGLYPEAN